MSNCLGLFSFTACARPHAEAPTPGWRSKLPRFALIAIAGVLVALHFVRHGR